MRFVLRVKTTRQESSLKKKLVVNRPAQSKVSESEKSYLKILKDKLKGLWLNNNQKLCSIIFQGRLCDKIGLLCD